MLVASLAGDIGGTNSRFQLATAPPSAGHSRKVIPGQKLFSQKYPNEKFDTFASVLEQFLQDATTALNEGGGSIELEIDVICVAVAG